MIQWCPCLGVGVGWTVGIGGAVGGGAMMGPRSGVIVTPGVGVVAAGVMVYSGVGEDGSFFVSIAGIV